MTSTISVHGRPHRGTSLADAFVRASGRAQPLIQLLCLFVLVVTTGCASGRIVIPPGEIPAAQMPTSEDEQYGQAVLAQLTDKYPLATSDHRINLVRDIVADLAKAAHADQDPWHVYVLKGDDVVNAAATRGNFVFVWTGMLNLSQGKGELATVLAHELGHVLARHTQPTPAEEVNQILSQVSGQVTQQVLLNSGYGIFAELAAVLVASAVQALAVNPESQRKELEADQIGLFLMADAGYNPEEALTLWQKMSTSHSSDMGVINFLSTHPASEDRLSALRTMLPEAMARYRKEPRSAGRMPNASKSSPSASSSAPALPDGDSFDYSQVPATKHPVHPGKPPPPNKEAAKQSPARPDDWVVVEPSTMVLSEPNGQGAFVTRLNRGDRVTITTRHGRWFRVVYPVDGYVFGPDLSPP